MTAPTENTGWEPVGEKDKNGRHPAWRLAVPGGWIYTVYTDCGSGGIGESAVFVPKPPEGSDAPIHVCDHGYAAMSCAHCEIGRRIMLEQNR